MMRGSGSWGGHRHRHAQAVAILAAETRAQAALVREQAIALAQYRKIIDRASAQAKIGVWECNLADNALTWTGGTYDLFELPRGSTLTRSKIVACYDAESCREMERLRAKAIEERSGFSLDARITTAKGNERWMRLTANVECEEGTPVRIFGMKQDITEEKMLHDRLRFLADCDLLTGLANRGVVQRRLLAAPGCEIPQSCALLLVDLDGFKQINDTFGHTAGDECLKQVAVRLRRVCHRGELVARIGGDEFAVVIGADADRRRVEETVGRILAELRLPIDWNAHSFQISASIGAALTEGSMAPGASQLFIEADLALYAAKADGRNTSRTFTADLKAEAEARFMTIGNIAPGLGGRAARVVLAAEGAP